jgi:Family of unknown function (DUF6236)
MAMWRIRWALPSSIIRGEIPMGEAKRRQASEVNYGKTPKAGRGLVVSCPIEINGSNFTLRSSDLDPQELRMALLFWDRLAWPTSNFIHVEGGNDSKFLIEAGVLIRPAIQFTGFMGTGALIAAQALAYRRLEEASPGGWAIAQGENSMLIKHGAIQEGRGAYVELIRAIPVPDKEVPLCWSSFFGHTDRLFDCR